MWVGAPSESNTIVLTSSTSNAFLSASSVWVAPSALSPLIHLSAAALLAGVARCNRVPRRMGFHVLITWLNAMMLNWTSPLSPRTAFDSSCLTRSMRLPPPSPSIGGSCASMEPETSITNMMRLAMIFSLKNCAASSSRTTVCACSLSPRSLFGSKLLPTAFQ